MYACWNILVPTDKAEQMYSKPTRLFQAIVISIDVSYLKNICIKRQRLMRLIVLV